MPETEGQNEGNVGSLNPLGHENRPINIKHSPEDAALMTICDVSTLE